MPSCAVCFIASEGFFFSCEHSRLDIRQCCPLQVCELQFKEVLRLLAPRVVGFASDLTFFQFLLLKFFKQKNDPSWVLHIFTVSSAKHSLNLKNASFPSLCKYGKHRTELQIASCVFCFWPETRGRLCFKNSNLKTVIKAFH